MSILSRIKQWRENRKANAPPKPSIGQRIANLQRNLVEKQGQYRRSRPITSVKTAQAISQAAAGRSLPIGKKSKKVKYGKGRPRGPSGKYIIPGKGAVNVYEYRKWLSTQKRIAILQASQKQAQMPQSQPQNPQIEARRQQITRQPIQNYPPQQQPQQVYGVSLNTGWDLLKIRSPLQSQAPINPNKGLSQFEVQRPVTNPDGDWYTESDFFTGRQVLRRRIGWETKW